MTKRLIVAPLILVLLLTSCTPNAIALLDAIVVAAEVVIPSIPGLQPQDANAINTYVNAALNITNDLITNGTDPQNIAKAVTDFNTLALPQLSQNVPPSVVVLLQGVSTAIQAFLNAYKNIQPLPPQPLTARNISGVHSQIKISPKDAKKLEGIRIRIARAKSTLFKR